jgi:hypothetical protein
METDEFVLEVLSRSLSPDRPRGLVNKLQEFSAELSEDLDVAHDAVRVSDVLSRLSDPNDRVRLCLHEHIIHWDNMTTTAKWAGGTEKLTAGRREKIYVALGLSGDQVTQVQSVIPIPVIEPTITIAKDHRSWFGGPKATEGYWPAYREFLIDKRGFSPENVEILDEASSDIVGRLADPRSPEAYQSKGLVVGYVQSGKTANLTAVIAKAIDAGYRFIIVLSGRTDLLRNQTQRRLDMELLGVPNLAGGDGQPPEDYLADKHWPDGFRQELVESDDHPGTIRIIRLTSATSDFTKSKGFNPVDPGINNVGADPDLSQIAARIAVVKKQKSRLEMLLGAVKGLNVNTRSLPALIIDDESDEASVNTKRPTKEEVKERTAINDLIRRIRSTLVRSQYVGYTATPFANVFVNPEEYDDLFPSDFITCLGAPEGYLGARHYCDLDEELNPIQDYVDLKKGQQISSVGHLLGLSSKYAFVRSVHSETEDPANQRAPRRQKLIEAIDSFVLAGALKLYRRDQGDPVDVRHHTMLVHENVQNKIHSRTKAEIEGMWSAAGYEMGPGFERLGHLLEDDFRLVSSARAPELAMPASIDELSDYVVKCVAEVNSGESAVRVVNSAGSGDEDPDFDQSDVWSIIVGGTKLSRGYTVEGLTTTYFRRKTGTTDTLMQAGRWFGYRPGYGDLVRLYLGRSEPKGKGTLDIFEMFQAASRDEELFRRELARYVGKPGDEDRITPARIPPLVTASHGDLIPTARNKLYNAELATRNFGGEWIQKTGLVTKKSRTTSNIELFAQLLDGGDLPGGLRQLQNNDLETWNFSIEWDGVEKKFKGFVREVGHDALINVLEGYEWRDDRDSRGEKFNPMSLELKYLSGQDESMPDPEVDSWIVILPQVETAWNKQQIGPFRSSVMERKWLGERFNVLGEGRHRPTCESIVRIKREQRERLSNPNEIVEALSGDPRRGAVLLYLVGEKGASDTSFPTSIGFEILPPHNSHPKTLGWKVKGQEDSFARRT